MGIEKNDEGNFTVSAKIVTYNFIEDAEFVIDKSKSKFASTLRKAPSHIQPSRSLVIL